MRPFLIGLFFLLACGLSAQEYLYRINDKVVEGDSSQLHQLILLDYSRLLGTLEYVGQDSLYFRLRAAAEPSAIPLRDLRYVGLLTTAAADSARYVVPVFNDLTYERTAFPLNGKGQVRTINLLYAAVEWNLDQHIQLGVGLGGPFGILLTQKFRKTLAPGLHVGIVGQELLATPLVFLDNRWPLVGDIAAVVTLGDDRRFLNLGAGLLFSTAAGGDASPQQSFRLGVGGKLARKWHLYGEFLMTVPNRDDRFGGLSLFPGLTGTYASRRHRWQFGLFTAVFDQDSFVPPPLPYVGYIYYW